MLPRKDSCESLSGTSICCQTSTLQPKLRRTGSNKQRESQQHSLHLGNHKLLSVRHRKLSQMFQVSKLSRVLPNIGQRPHRIHMLQPILANHRILTPQQAMGLTEVAVVISIRMATSPSKCSNHDSSQVWLHPPHMALRLAEVHRLVILMLRPLSHHLPKPRT